MLYEIFFFNSGHQSVDSDSDDENDDDVFVTDNDVTLSRVYFLICEPVVYGLNVCKLNLIFFFLIYC